MAEETPKTIILGGKPEHHELPAASDATIMPGMLVERVNGTLRPHSRDGGETGRVAIEAREWGKGIGDTYVPREQVKYIISGAGDYLFPLLAAGQSATEGVGLVSNGAGVLRPVATDVDGNPTEDATWQASEDVDNSGGADPVNIRAERV